MIDPARHQALREKLVDLAIDALPPGEAREVEAHAAGCPECRAELASLRGVTEQAAALPPIEAPARGEAVLMAAARQAADQARSQRRLGLPSWFWSLALGGAGAAAVVVLALQLTSGAKGPLEAAPTSVAAPAAAPAVERDTIAPAAPPALAQAEEKKEAAPAPATLAPPPPRAAAAVAQEAEAPPRREELRAAPAPAPKKRDRLAEADLRPDDLGAAAPAAPPLPPPAGGAAAKAASGPGAIGFAAAHEEPPAPEQALAKPARAPAPAALREEAAGNLADSAAQAPPRPAAAAPAAERRAAAAGLAASAPRADLRPETRTDSACAAEQRRTLWRDGAGALVRRLRTGLHQGAPVAVDEAFGPDGRLASARVEAGGRTSVFGRGGLEAAGFVPVPGLRVAATAAEAERDPPACDAWPR